MKNNKYINTGLLLSTAVFSTLALAETCQNPVPVWADEFDGTALDTTKWEPMIGDGCSYGICGWGNNELQYYKAENATVANGILTITAKKERVQAKSYTSARLRTMNMPNGGQWKYGRYEARIKLPDGTGTWPAFWMLPTDPDQGWPMSGEIDIMEATGQADMVAFGTIHYGQPWPDNEWTSGRMLKQPDAWSDDFHVYAVEWEPGEIRWYIDDVLYSTKTPSDMSNPDFWTFDNYNYHFLLNVAVGGSIGGWVDDTMMPQTMDIDYVRVYDLGQAAMTGEHIVEPGSTETYSVTGAPAGSSYSWTGPDGQTSSGSTFNVNWSTQPGSVNLTVTSSCGTQQLAMDVHVSPEQSLSAMQDDFEGARAISYTSWTGAFNQAAANPGSDTINSSSVVGQYTRDAGSQWDVIAGTVTDIPNAALFVSGENAFYLDVYTAAPVGTEILIQLENSGTATSSNYPTGRHSKYIAHTSIQQGWERLKFVLEDRIDGQTGDNQVDTLVLLIDPDAFSGDTWYLDNLSIYAPDTGGNDPATSVQVSNLTTGTASASKGKKFGTATVTMLDNLGNPVIGETVTGQFSGSWNESATGTTDSAGNVSFQTTSSLGGSVTVNFCVSSVSGDLPLTSSANTCQ